jgi:uncharacterized protein YndB with AHSA1/START domain
MSTAVTQSAVDDLSLSITEEIHVNATPEATFDALLEELGRGMTGTEEKPMPMKIEAWPGGRWYRDLGDGNGHFWAHVQAIKRPTLLEFYGPLMLSFGVASNVQYRLRPVQGGTLITFHHYAVGAIPADIRTAMGGGWHTILERAKQRAEQQ